MKTLCTHQLTHFSSQIKRISADKRAHISHVSLLAALLVCSLQQGNISPFQITRKAVMQLAKIASVATYHKRIRELDAYGYIRYEPSYHPRKGSLVYWWMNTTTNWQHSNP